MDTLKQPIVTYITALIPECLHNHCFGNKISHHFVLHRDLITKVNSIKNIINHMFLLPIRMLITRFSFLNSCMLVVGNKCCYVFELKDKIKLFLELWSVLMMKLG